MPNKDIAKSYYEEKENNFAKGRQGVLILYMSVCVDWAYKPHA